MALASILFFIFIYKKVRRTTETGAGLRNNDGSADPDVKIVGQDEKYKRATWGICIGASIIVGPMLGFALGLALKLVIPTYYHIEDTTPNGHYTCYAINGNIGKELFGKYVFNNTDEEYYLCRKNYQYGTPDDKTTYVKAMTTLVQYPAGKDNDSYTIPESVTTVGDYAFCGNDYLTSLPLHDKLKVISDFAFAHVSGVPTFDVPAGTESIGESAFHDCWSLTDINVAKNNPNYTSVDGVLYDKEMNTLMQYPEGKTTPEYIAPKSLRNLGPYAFFGNKKLTTVDLPDGVASIGDFAFGWCQNLSSLTVRVADPATIELGLIPFFRGANAVDCTLRVPVGSKTKYENADLWKDFAPNIEELTSDGIDNVTADGQQADKAERVYSRDGVQLRGTLGQQQKGVYIVGGKKVVKR